MLQDSESLHCPEAGHQLSCWLPLEHPLRETGFCTDSEGPDISVGARGTIGIHTPKLMKDCVVLPPGVSTSG